MKILTVGDCHMNPRWSRLAADVALRENVDAIFQVGDFGFSFDHYFLKGFEDAHCPVYWIPGNHDNYDYLEAVGAHRGEDEMKEIWPNIWHVPRVHVWEWDGRKFAACGGAFSIDQDFRRPHLDYWPQEVLTQEDLDDARARSEKIDVFFSHDVPYGVPFMEEALDAMKGAIGRHLEVGSLANRMTLRKVVEQFGPKLLIHGHHHVFYEDSLELEPNDNTVFPGTVRVIGLNCDGTNESMVVLNTDDLTCERALLTHNEVVWGA